jgi:ubiquinone/menaquinone biosynthesis C-methylase UbiE
MNHKNHSELISNNRKVHDLVATRYDRVHSEIFNNHEQQRIVERLKAISSVLENSNWTALDFGCGSGNITAHLVAMGFDVTSADISPKFLSVINERFGKTGNCKTEILSGDINKDLLDRSYDLICIYSVLHHIPDYISVLQGLAKRLNPGGYLYIDHKASEAYWSSDPDYAKLQQECKWRRVAYKIPCMFSLNWIIGKLRRFHNPRYQPEGDIHVWPDDHVQWSLIRTELEQLQMQEVFSEDYLVYQEYYGRELFDRYSAHVSDMHCSVFRKIS